MSGGNAAAEQEVRTDRLVRTINRLLDWHGAGAQRPSCEGTVRGSAIRVLRERPRVPFRLGCDPLEALETAELRLVRPFTGDVEHRRPPAPARWEDDVSAGHFGLQALFGLGEYADAIEEVLFYPPGVEFDLPVWPAGRGD